jgi:hypothetical protein
VFFVTLASSAAKITTAPCLVESAASYRLASPKISMLPGVLQTPKKLLWTALPESQIFTTLTPSLRDERDFLIMAFFTLTLWKT